jgi:hypothetical protein
MEKRRRDREKQHTDKRMDKKEKGKEIEKERNNTQIKRAYVKEKERNRETSDPDK